MLSRTTKALFNTIAADARALTRSIANKFIGTHYKAADLLDQAVIEPTAVEQIDHHSETFVHMRDYSNNSAPQQFGAQMVSEMIERLATPMILDRDTKSPFGYGVDSQLNVVEFGCATGNSSLDPLLKIEKIAGPSLKIKAVMNDLPLNDWNTLRKTLGANVPDIEVEVSSQSMYAGPYFCFNK